MGEEENRSLKEELKLLTSCMTRRLTSISNTRAKLERVEEERGRVDKQLSEAIKAKMFGNVSSSTAPSPASSPAAAGAGDSSSVITFGPGDFTDFMEQDDMDYDDQDAVAPLYKDDMPVYILQPTDCLEKLKEVNSYISVINIENITKTCDDVRQSLNNFFMMFKGQCKEKILALKQLVEGVFMDYVKGLKYFALSYEKTKEVVNAWELDRESLRDCREELQKLWQRNIQAQNDIKHSTSQLLEAQDAALNYRAICERKTGELEILEKYIQSTLVCASKEHDRRMKAEMEEIKKRCERDIALINEDRRQLEENLNSANVSAAKYLLEMEDAAELKKKLVLEKASNMVLQNRLGRTTELLERSKRGEWVGDAAPKKNSSNSIGSNINNNSDNNIDPNSNTNIIDNSIDISSNGSNNNVRTLDTVQQDPTHANMDPTTKGVVFNALLPYLPGLMLEQVEEALKIVCNTFMTVHMVVSFGRGEFNVVQYKKVMRFLDQTATEFVDPQKPKEGGQSLFL